jgi:hypothetical protein
VIQSLPVTAYIKMVDIWMLFMMCYPFLIVSLYTVREVAKNQNNKVKNNGCTWLEEDEEDDRKIRNVSYLLNWGLPLFMSIFISLYWTIGMLNYFSPNMHGVC